MIKNITAVLLCLLFYYQNCIAQVNTKTLPLTADSLASGNYKDVFKSFFQLAANHLISNNKEIQFSSNPFAVIAKMDSSLLKSNNYKKYTHLRNLNFSFSAKLDSTYKFNGFSSGVKYALINNRDETVSKAFVILASTADQEYTNLFNTGAAFIVTQSNSPELATQWTNFFNGQIKFNQLDLSLQKLVKDSTKSKNLSKLLQSGGNWDIRQSESKLYDSLRSRFHERSLWTIGLSDTTYKNKFFFSNIVLSTEYIKGLDDPTKPIRAIGVEFNSIASYNFLDDTLQAKRDLRKQILQVEPGINIVLRNKNNLYSLAEFKISGSYYHNFGSLYANEKRDSVTLNGTLRIRIINDIWIPLEIRYNPKSGNVFGFLNIKFNFNGLKNTLGGAKKENSKQNI
jgi:hypothetical protein